MSRADLVPATGRPRLSSLSGHTRAKPYFPLPSNLFSASCEALGRARTPLRGWFVGVRAPQKSRKASCHVDSSHFPIDSRCLLLFDSLEEIGFDWSRAGHDAGRKVKELRISELCDVCVERRKHRRLSGVRMKCGDLRFQVSPNFDARGERWQGDRLAVRQRSGRGRVVKLVYAVGKQAGGELIGKTVVAS